MSMNFNKQNKNEVNVNTRGYRFMNKDGFCPSTLVCGYWNEMISLKIHPALPESKQTQSSVYDYNQMIATSLSIEKALILVKKTQEIVYPAIKQGQSRSVAVLIGGNNLVQVGCTAENGKVISYVGIHKNLDPETKRPQESLYYEFLDSSQITISDYDPETGAYGATEPVNCELETFIEILKASIKALCGAFTHDMRHRDKFYRDKLCNDMAQIAGKLGVELSNGGSGGGYSSRTNISFGGGSSGGGNQQTNVNNINNMSDIDSFLD